MQKLDKLLQLKIENGKWKIAELAVGELICNGIDRAGALFTAENIQYNKNKHEVLPQLSVVIKNKHYQSYY